MPGKRRPRPFAPIDREYLAQDTVRELGERFGPAGPLVFLAIILEAGKVPSGGIIEMRFRALARLAFVDVETAQAIVCAAAEAELITDLERDARRFRGCLTRWNAWEAKDPTSAQRSADYRSRREDEPA